MWINSLHTDYCITWDCSYTELFLARALQQILRAVRQEKTLTFHYDQQMKSFKRRQSFTVSTETKGPERSLMGNVL